MSRQTSRGFVLPGMSSMLMYAAVAVAVALFLAAVYGYGYKAGKALLADYKLEQAEKTIEVIREVEKVVTKVEVEYRDRVVRVEERGETIVKEVPVYVTKADDAACELRNGAVRVHDGAASNVPPAPPVESDRAPSGFSLSEALSVIADNYKLGHLWKERAQSCVAAYEGARAKINASGAENPR